jgi:allantoicase
MSETAFAELVDLASGRVGGVAVAANDDFFASRENLVKAGAPVWREGEYTDRGKWMDGWETRRRRQPGHDWCIIRLGLPGMVRGVIVDTSHFTGNYPEACSIDACAEPGTPDGEHLSSRSTVWTEILSRKPLLGNAHNVFPVEVGVRTTHVRLNIFPDGGVARLRVFGYVVPDWDRLLRAGGDLDLASVELGGLVVAASDMFFGSRHNLIMPGRATHMGDGWETRRRRGPGHDWAIVRLGRKGTLRRVQVDTTHFKGNAPGACSLEACLVEGATSATITGPDVEWQEVLPPSKLEPHTLHTFEDEVRAIGPVTLARFNIFPDGGVGRLRLFGRVAG